MGEQGEAEFERPAAAGKLNAARRVFSSKLLIEWLLCAIGAVAVLLIQNLGWLTDDDAAADALMRYHVGVTQERRGFPFAFIAVDEESFAHWNEPLITPRDSLAKIIEFARASGAKLIFVDVELTRFQDGKAFRQECRDKNKPATCAELDPGDARLAQVLTQQQTSSPPIILARTIVSTRDSASGEPRRTVRPSFLDPILGPDHPGVYWASPLYSVDKDHVIRRERLWELACNCTDVEAIPAVELLAVALLDPDHEKAAQLMAMMRSIPKERDCLDLPPDRAGPEQLELQLSNGDIFDIAASAKTARNRILYSIEWSPRQSRRYADQPQGEERSRMVMREGGRETDLVTTIPAAKLIEKIDAETPTDKTESKPPTGRTDTENKTRQLLAGHIVVIGSTHSHAGDLHATPLGIMPGAVVIMNAINSFYQNGQLTEPIWWMKLLFSLAMITISVVIYNALWAMLAVLLIPVIIFAVSFLTNTLFIRHGVWIDAAIPALIYSMFKNIHYYVLELNGRAKERRRPGDNWVTPWLRALRH